MTEEGDVIERDHIVAFRRQAKEILDKWKPYLLESFISSPYRWCFIDSTTSRVRFVEESPQGASFYSKAMVRRLNPPNQCGSRHQQTWTGKGFWEKETLTNGRPLGKGLPGLQTEHNVVSRIGAELWRGVYYSQRRRKDAGKSSEQCIVEQTPR